MRLTLNPNSVTDYGTFLKIKTLPKYRFIGRTAEFPDEYAALLGLVEADDVRQDYEPLDGLFDYQRDISRTAIAKQKYAVFADCGLGKTLIMLEFARHAAQHMPQGKAILIVSPLMVVRQTVAEAKRFYGDALPIDVVKAADLSWWMEHGAGRIGITNYDALKDDTPQGRLGGLILDESSMLKSHYGKWGTDCIRLGKGLAWKLALTGTPAPNDRIEYANHAVFLDQFPTVNAFLARFFVNRGKTDNRWELKPHALEPFYRTLSHWCIFLTDPAVYGWKDNAQGIPPIHVHVENIDLTTDQRNAVHETTGMLFVDRIGGITSRTKLARMSKGCGGVESKKPQYVVDLVDRVAPESVLVWCMHNDEQDKLASMMPHAANIDGQTPQEKRETLIAEFQRGERRVLISKPRILGFGLNLQVATRQIFSGLQDSYESFYQAVKRSNRYGSTQPLHVHIPITELEAPMIDTVLRKAKRVQDDTREQERMFRQSSLTAGVS